MTETLVKSLFGAAFLAAGSFLLRAHFSMYEVLGAYLVLVAVKI